MRLPLSIFVSSALVLFSACSNEHKRTICIESDDNCLVVASGSVSAVDADTFVHEKVRYRLYSWDGPEIGQYAQCSEENTRGRQALFAAQELLSQSEYVTIKILDETPTGVKLADIFLDEFDFGAILEEKEFVTSWNHESSEKKPDWCGRLPDQ